MWRPLTAFSSGFRYVKALGQPSIVDFFLSFYLSFFFLFSYLSFFLSFILSFFLSSIVSEGKSVLVGIAISVSIPCPACGYDRYVAYCNGWFGALPVGAAKHVYCERPTLGMQVNIMRAGKPVMLALCEVEVYGMPYVEGMLKMRK